MTYDYISKNPGIYEMVNEETNDWLKFITIGSGFGISMTTVMLNKVHGKIYQVSHYLQRILSLSYVSGKKYNLFLRFRLKRYECF